MTIRNLFKKEKILAGKSQEDLTKDVESTGSIKAKLLQKQRFIASSSYSTPEGFAKFGLAEKYYNDAITRIYSEYPYDGSEKERTEFFNSSSYLELYLLENRYPKTNGYITISKSGWGATGSGGGGIYGEPANHEYILVTGNLNTASGGMAGKPLSQVFDKSNKFDIDKKRSSNLELNFNEGVTLEFWLKKNSYIGFENLREVIFDLWNGESITSNKYGRFRLELDSNASNPLYLNIVSASINLQNSIDIERNLNVKINNNFTTGTFFDWNHYAVAIKSSGSSTIIKTYLNGQLNDTIEQPVSFGAIIGSQYAAIGSLVNEISGGIFDRYGKGYGKLSGSLDEFRYWKTERTGKDISRFWFRNVFGGANSDTSNTDLGLYYKFNEGITGTSSVDSTVLDYSGRISNGKWIGYNRSHRSTDSAIVSASAALSEEKDPIIYSFHPKVSALLGELRASGSAYDQTNNSALFLSLPSWITDEDELRDGNLKNLTQIMASYFDTLYLQTRYLPNLNEVRYFDTGSKQNQFIKKGLAARGLEVPELFANADVLAYFQQRGEQKNFERDIDEIKNRIYQNIYNNLPFIFKSKGTEKSIRNIIRCFGVDEELINIKVYTNNADYILETNYKPSSVKRKYIDFYDPDRYDSTIYQQTSSNSNSVSFISGNYLDNTTEDDFGEFTLETEVIFPKRRTLRDENYFRIGFVSSSIAGFHSADTGSSDDFTWPSNDYDARIYFVKIDSESDSGYFLATGSAFSLTSSIINNIYNNEKWQIALKFSPNTNVREDSFDADGKGYLVEFYAVNTVFDTIVREVKLSGAVEQSEGFEYLNSPKRVYAGCHRLNFTGSDLQKTDIKIGSVKYWLKRLEDSDIVNHAINPESYGVLQNTYGNLTNLDSNLDIKNKDSLILNWDFTSISSSDAGISGVPTVSDAGFEVNDISSGSSELVTKFGKLGNLLGVQHTGRGDFFIPNRTNVVDLNYLYSGRLNEIENSSNIDSISTFGETDVIFTRDTKPLTSFVSIEKSMYASISKEMLNMFASMIEFNNIIGEPVNRYRQEYKALEKLREKFFRNIQNEPDLDKYISYYIWLDDAVTMMIRQLLPASSDSSTKVRNIIESHVLERNKFWNKFPTYEFKVPEPEGGAKGVSEFNYPYSSGSYPLDNSENSNGFWWKFRADRQKDNPTGFAAVDASRAAIHSASLSAFNRAKTTSHSSSANQSVVATGSSIIPKTIQNNNNPVQYQGILDPQNFGNYDFSIYDKIRIDKKVINYSSSYEILQTSGRKENNRDFIKNGGYDIVEGPSEFISGTYDYEIPTRIITKNVFVSRFSAPGGPEIAPTLDINSREYSPYNDYNTRNFSVREIQNAFLSYHSNQFGFSSGGKYLGSSSVESDSYDGTGSYHKYNRNTGVRRVYSDPDNSNTAIVNYYDNGFISHAIPQQDISYSWITRSFDASQEYVLGHAPKNGFMNISGTYEEAIKFISSSEVGNSDFIQPFNNLNYLIYEPLTPSASLLGYDQGINIDDYRNTEFLTIDSELTLNALLSKRGSIYGYPSWKQTRTGDNPVAMSWRKNNLIGLQETNESIIIENENIREPIIKQFGDLRLFDEPAVLVSKYYPLVLTLAIDEDENSTELITLEVSYTNQYSQFSNEELNDKLLNEITDETSYKNITSLYLNGNLDNLNSPARAFLFLEYKESIYPPEQYFGSNKVRNRIGYSNNFWVVNPQERRTIGSILSNSQGFSVSQSMWPLDESSDVTTVYTANNANESGLGELQNPYVHIHDGDKSNVKFGPLYARRQTLASSGSTSGFSSIRSPWTGSETGQPTTSSYPYAPYPRGNMTIFNGVTEWSASVQAGVIENGVFETTASYPSTTYGEYVELLRTKNKNYSIIPEFRISKHIEDISKNSNSNDFSMGQNILELVGLSSSVLPTDSSKDNFFKIYSNSDFMKYFSQIKEDHRELAIPSKIKLECSALVKFLPYNSFYPADRTLDLVSRFSSSYLQYISSSGADSNSNNFAKPLYSPMFAPGILFNTIKSGIAVDYPVYISRSADAWQFTKMRYNAITSSTGGIDEYHNYWSLGFGTGSATRFANSTQYPDSDNLYVDTASYDQEPFVAGASELTIQNGVETASLGWHKRVPFEALLEPEKYIKDVVFIDNEPHPSSSMELTCSWSGEGDNLYKLMSSNFFGETMRFFLKNEKPTTISSLPENHPDFGNVEAGNVYGMRIKLRKSLNKDKLIFDFDLPQIRLDDLDTKENFTMYSRPSAFGPPVASYTRLTPGAELTSVEQSSRIYSDGIDGLYPCHTPPYYDGSAWIDIFYTASETGKVTLEDILNNSKATYYRIWEGKGANAVAGRLRNANGWIEIRGVTLGTLPSYFGPLYNAQIANRYAMQLSASINFNKKVEIPLPIFNAQGDIIEVDQTKITNIWNIQTKFETPMLNFSSSEMISSDRNKAMNNLNSLDYGPSSRVYGMWHQFGKLPDDENKGIFLEVGEIPDNWLKLAVPDYIDDPEIKNLYNNGNIRSMIELVGFGKNDSLSKRVGEVKEEHIIREAIVAVPFVESEGEQILFNIPKKVIRGIIENRENNRIEDQAQLAGSSIIDMVEKMQRYIFPPTMDFINNQNVDPFSMYIFEFEYKLDKNDLVHIWQNVLPPSAKRFFEKTATIEHDLLTNELMGHANKKAGEAMRDKTRWLVFRVKERAENNYFNRILADKPGGIEPILSYNWPYDFCSIVEFGKLDASITFEKEGSEKEDNLIEKVFRSEIAEETRSQATISRKQRRSSFSKKRPDNITAAKGIKKV